jgi:2-oxoglutarate dehydrogenase E1 component
MLVCSGKLYYDLEEARTRGKREDITLVRLEQLYPFPQAELAQVLRAAPAEVVWVQEEPANFGIWTWVRSRLEAAIAQAGVESPLSCLARAESPSPAGSFHGDHEADQTRLVAQAIAGH